MDSAPAHVVPRRLASVRPDLSHAADDTTVTGTPASATRSDTVGCGCHERVHTLPAKQVDDPVLPRHRRAVADHAVPPHGETGAQRREAGRGRGGKPGTQVRRPRRVHQGCQERRSVAPGTQLQQPEPRRPAARKRAGRRHAHRVRPRSRERPIRLPVRAAGRPVAGHPRDDQPPERSLSAPASWPWTARRQAQRARNDLGTLRVSLTRNVRSSAVTLPT